MTQLAERLSDLATTGTRTITFEDIGLPADTVLGILEEDDGRLWVSTPSGLSRFDPRAASFTNYDASDGLFTDRFSSPVVAATGLGGEMFFGSPKGLVAFFPKEIAERKPALPVFLTDVRLFGEPVLPGTAPLERPIWSTAALALDPDSIVSFETSKARSARALLNLAAGGAAVSVRLVVTKGSKRGAFPL